MVNLSVHSDCVCFNNSSVTWSSSASYRVRRRLLSQKLSHQREELVPPPPPPPDPPLTAAPALPCSSLFGRFGRCVGGDCGARPSVTSWEKFLQWAERKKEVETHTHTHTHTQVCAPGGLRTDNSSSSHRGEKFCQRSHTSFIYYLFIVRNIYYGNVQDERSDEEPVHVRGHQESGAGGELLDVIQSLRSDFLLLSTSRQVCLCPV